MPEQHHTQILREQAFLKVLEHLAHIETVYQWYSQELFNGVEIPEDENDIETYQRAQVAVLRNFGLLLTTHAQEWVFG